MKKTSRTTSINNNEHKLGFTMVEVTLVMAFIGMLLIAVAMVLANIISVYQKGLVIKSVDSVGRGLVSELNSSINSAPSVDSDNLCNLSNSGDCPISHAYEFIFQSRNSAIDDEKQLGGAFCTGNYTYIWNTYYGINEKNTIELTYNTSTETNKSIKDFKMIKFSDPNYRTCSAIVEDSGSNFQNGKINITQLPNKAKYTISPPEDGFIDSTDVDLYLYELTIFPISQDQITHRAFFSGTFILATDRGDVNILSSDNTCNPNALITGSDGDGESGSTLDIGSEFNYCAVNKFNFADRSAGKITNK